MKKWDVFIFIVAAVFINGCGGKSTIAPTPTYKILGVIANASETSGNPSFFVNATVKLWTEGLETSLGETTTSATGSFQFTNVPPGNYSIDARSTVTTTPHMASSSMRVSVTNADLNITFYATP